MQNWLFNINIGKKKVVSWMLGLDVLKVGLFGGSFIICVGVQSFPSASTRFLGWGLIPLGKPMFHSILNHVV
jgi:hypothetical protein